MTARVALSCDGVVWPAMYACGQATPVGSPRDGAEARQTAHLIHHWRVGLRSTGGEQPALVDLCSRCAKLAEQHPERGIRLLPVGSVRPALVA